MKRILTFFIILVLANVSAKAQRRATRVIDNKGNIKMALDSSSRFIDTAYNGLTKLNDSTLGLGGALTQTTIIDVNGNSLQIANLVSGVGTDSVVVADPTTGELKRVSASRLFGNLGAKNGITKVGDTIKLGGSLTEATIIDADGTNTLTLNATAAGAIKISGMTSGQNSDSVLVVDPVTNSLRYVSASKLLSVLGAGNGLTKNGDTVELGGQLTKPATITTSASNTLAIDGLQSGSFATDSVVVADPTTGQLKRAAASTLLNSGESSFTASAGTLTYTVTGVPTDVTRVWVYRNGAKLKSGVDYTVSGGDVTFVQNGYTLTTGDEIEVQWVK
jgi:hypothetical protein